MVRLARARWSGTILSLAIALVASTAWGARPLDTEDADVLALGQVELELGGMLSLDSAERIWAARGALNFGVLPRLELGIQSSALVLDPDGESARGGLGDTQLNLKYRPFVDTGPWPAVLGSVFVRLPTGDEDRGLGQSDVDVGALLVLAQRMGPVTLTGNAGYVFVVEDRDHDLWLLSLSLEYRASASLTLVGEVVSALSAHHEPDRALLRTGLVYAISPRITLDAAVAAGVTRGSPDLIFTTGLTIKLF